jgi:hypothetical protein
MRPYDGELKHCPTVYRVGDLDNWRWLQWGIIMYICVEVGTVEQSTSEVGCKFITVNV